MSEEEYIEGENPTPIEEQEAIEDDNPEAIEDDNPENTESSGLEGEDNSSLLNIQPEDFAIKQTDISLIAGKRGSGKTNLLLYLIHNIHQSGINYVVVDPVRDLEAEMTHWGQEYTRNIIHINYQDRDAFDRFLKRLYKLQWKGVLVCDEIDGFMPNGKSLSKIQNHLIQISRHYGIGIMGVTRRLARLHTDFPSQSNKLWLFKHWTRADLDYLKQSNLGEYTVFLRFLKKFHTLFVNNDSGRCAVCSPCPKMK